MCESGSDCLTIFPLVIGCLVLRMSLARLRSLFSRRSCSNPSASAVVSPPRLPSSLSACRTQRRRVSAVQPNFAEIDGIAAHCELPSY